MPRRRSRSGRRKRLFKRLLIVFVVLAILTGVAFGVRYFIRRGSGAELQAKANEAHQAMVAGEYSKARLLYEDVLDKLPRKLTVRRNLTNCYLREEKFEQARKIAKGTLDFAPEDAPAHRTLAMLAESEGNFEVALQHARSAEEGKERPVDSLLYIAKLHFARGSHSEGVEALSKAVFEEQVGDQAALLLAPYVQGKPVSDEIAAQVRRMLGTYLNRARSELADTPADENLVGRAVRLALLASRPADAVELLRKVKEERELTPTEKAMLSQALVAEGQISEARKLMREASYVPPSADGSSRPTLSAGETAAGWLRAGEPELALEAVEKALEEAPESLALLRVRMRALYQLLQTPGATRTVAESATEIEDAASEILKVLPTDEQALRYRGAIRLDRGEFAGALADAKALREVAPRSASAQWLLGLAYQYVGMPTNALPLLLSGRSGATSKAGGSRWILRVALRCGKGDLAAEEASRLPEPRDAALRGAALALRGELDEAEAVTQVADYERCPVEDRARLALALAERGRPEQARSVAEELRSLAASSGASLRIYELLRAAGDTEGARTALEQAAAAGGAGAIRALLVLGEQAVVRVPPDEDAVGAAVERLNGIPGGRPFARLLEGRAALARGEPDAALEAAREAGESDLPIPAARVLILAAMQRKGVVGPELEKAAAAVLEVAPGYAPARQIRAQGLMRALKDELGRGQVREAEGLASEFLEVQPQRADAQLLRGLLRSQIGEAGLAEEDARALLKTEESAGAGRLLLGLIRYRNGDVEQAVEEFRMAVAAAPESPGAMAALGLALVGAGRPADALPAADRLDELEGAGSRAVMVRVSALVALRRYDEAVDVLQKRLEVQPENLSTRLLCARVLFQAGRKVEAAAEFEQVVRARPELAAGHVGRVSAQISLGRFDDALASAEAAMATKGLELTGILLRSRVLGASGDKDAEMRELRTAIEKYPNHTAARELLGIRLIETGRAKAGADELRRVIELNPRNVRAHYRLGLLAEGENRELDAVRHYKDVLKLDPGNIVAANNLAYRLLEDPVTRDRAIQLADMAVKGNPEEGEFRDTFALALSAAGRHEEAVHQAEEGMRLLPRKSSIAITAARVYQAAGDNDRARKAAAQALRNASPADREAVSRQIRALNLPPIR